MLSHRSKVSFAQFLRMLSQSDFNSLLLKHELYEGYECAATLEAFLPDAEEGRLLSMLEEILRTRSTLRSAVSPRYRFDERWEDLKICLLLDGIEIDERYTRIVAIDPTIEGSVPVEDDLDRALRSSGLPSIDDISRLLIASSDSFRASPPNYNSCMSNARVALETLARDIANHRVRSRPGHFDAARWGEVLAYLRVSNFITSEEETGIAGVYRFVSPGAHTPIDSDEIEMARLGRMLILSMCYFLLRRNSRAPS